jgi:hypothetical protein
MRRTNLSEKRVRDQQQPARVRTQEAQQVGPATSGIIANAASVLCIATLRESMQIISVCTVAGFM